MTPDRIVEALDVIERICSGLISAAMHFPGSAFVLSEAKETLHRPRCRRHCPVRVMQQRIRLAVRAHQAHAAINPKKSQLIYILT